MSENIWADEETFNDSPVEYSNGQWVEQEHGEIPPPVARPQRSAPKPQAPVQQTIDQYESIVNDLIEDDEEDLSVLSDATLRLEQGRLYQMVMNHNLFQGMDADPRAIKNVQREIRKFARERMEIMLGMRQESQANTPAVIASPFSEMEVQALKMLASKITGGKNDQPAPVLAAPPAKKELTPISGTTKPKTPAPIAQPKPAQKLAPKPQAPIKRQAPVVNEDPEVKEINTVMDGVLQKPVQKMTEQELIEHNKRISEKQAGRRAKATNALPMPTPDQEEMLYTQRAANGSISVGGKQGTAVSAILAAINNSKK